MSIKDKLRIIEILFRPCLSYNDKRIDNEFFEDYTHAFGVAAYKPDLSKDDLIYINKTVKKLIKIVGKDEITKDYVKMLLRIEGCGGFVPDKKWLNAYKTLICYLQSRLPSATN